jgi:predicted helicase
LPARDRVLLSGRGAASVFPLYLYSEEHGETVKTPNIAPEFVAQIKEAVGREPSPEEIFYYIYAVLHSRTYRTRYAEFLKIDFPRVPLPKNNRFFEKLGALGEELVAYHLLKKKSWGDLEQKGEATDTTVGKVFYNEADKEIVLDAKKQAGEQVRIGPIEKEIWEFHIGGYQVPHKWLKDRKGMKIDIEEYAFILNALINTDRLMTELDPVFEEMILEGE